MSLALEITPVVFGSMGISDLERCAAERLIHAAIDHGMTSIDTAPLYGAGRCEELIGRAIADRRSRVQVLTKCGIRWDGEHGESMFEMPISGALRTVRKDSRPSSIRRDIDESLARLGIEAIDLLQIHQLDTDSPLEDSLNEIESARKAGKVRAIGISNFPSRETEQAHRFLEQGLFSVQDELSLVSRDRATPLLPVCRELGARFLAYSPLAHGVLSGKYLDSGLRQARKDWGAFYTAPENLVKINAMLRETALPIAAACGASLSQLSLLWALHQQGVTSVVAGARKERQIIENATTLEIDIDEGEFQRLTAAIEACQLNWMPVAGIAERFGQQARRVTGAGRRLLKKIARR